MKKLLVFALLLGLVSVSEAGTVSVVGDTILGWGQTKTYTIIYSGSPAITSFDMDVHFSNYNATASNWTIVATNRDTTYDFIMDPYTTPPDIGKEITTCTADWLYLPSEPLGNIWITFNLTAGSNLGIINITLEDIFFSDTDWNQTNPAMGSLQVNIVPEPGTFLMLILGGLVAKKRRRHLSS
jgi:hypothetical protein